MPGDPNIAQSRKLLHAANDLLAVAWELELGSEAEPANGARYLEPSDAVLVELARQVYHARRMRSDVSLLEGLIGEPVWDIMLDLFIAAHENRMVSVTKASFRSGVPHSTAMRTLGLLERRGLVVREPDARDKRRTFVRISTAAFAEFLRYFRRVANGHSAFALLSPKESEVETYPSLAI